MMHANVSMLNLQVARLNAAIDAHHEDLCERQAPILRNTKAGTPMAGDGKTGRMDMGGMLGWNAPHREGFRELLAHPKLIPYIHML